MANNSYLVVKYQSSYSRLLTTYNDLDTFEAETLGIGELAVYPAVESADNSYTPVKIGNGQTVIKDLPYIAYPLKIDSSNPNIDLSSITQDVKIAEGHNLTITGDLNVEGNLKFNALEANCIQIENLPDSDKDATNKSYVDKALTDLENSVDSKIKADIKSYVDEKLLNTAF